MDSLYVDAATVNNIFNIYVNAIFINAILY